MSEEKTEQPPVEVPYWEKKDGRIYIEGVDVTDIANPEGIDQPEEAPKTDPDNAVVEGEEKTEEPPEPPEPEPDKEEVKPPEESAPDKDEKADTPEKLKFKLKFRGKEEEVEYAPDQLQVRLNKLRAFEENEKEFWERNNKVKPYEQIVESPWFKEKLKEAYETGELQQPPPAPEVPNAVQYELLKRKADPDYDQVLSALRDYAMSLPPDAVQLLDSDPNVFLPEYDRLASQVRAKKETPPPEEKKAAPATEDVRKKLAFKEAAKKTATVTQPGVQGEQVSRVSAWQKRDRELMKALKDPANAHRNLDLAAEILMHRDNRPTQ